MLEERMEDFINKEVQGLYEQGSYSDEVREVYQDLMCLGVGANSAENIVRKILEKIAGIKVDRLPKKTFAKYMYLEVRGLPQFQVADELLDSWKCQDKTLYNDGTSKYGYSYSTYDILTSSGEGHVIGLRDMAGGTAEEQLEVFKQVLTDVVSMKEGKNDGGDNDLVGKIFFNQTFYV